MIGMMSRKIRIKDDGERPFWISYSDLMTTLMVLFLVVMSVTILTITQELLDKQARLIEQQKELERTNARLLSQQAELAQAKILMDSLKQSRDQRQKAIKFIFDKIKAASEKDEYRGRINVTNEPLIVDFGESARFSRGDFHLSREGVQILQSFMPEILKIIESSNEEGWFNRITVEGFTDTDGSYLFNLDLSLKRAQSVVCTLLAPGPGEIVLTQEQQKKIQDIFMVGGFSFNSARSSKEASRRVEMRFDFKTVEDHLSSADYYAPMSASGTFSAIEVGKCRLK